MKAPLSIARKASERVKLIFVIVGYGRALVTNAVAHVTCFEAKLWELLSWESVRTLQVVRFVNYEFVEFFHKLLFSGSFHARNVSKIAARWVCAVSCVRSKGISLIISRIVTAKWTFLSGSVDAYGSRSLFDIFRSNTKHFLKAFIGQSTSKKRRQQVHAQDTQKIALFINSSCLPLASIIYKPDDIR